MAKKTSAFRIIIVVLCYVILSMAGLEALLRLKNSAQDVYDIEMWRYSNTLKRHSENPILGHEHIPSSRAVLQNVAIRLNTLGLRGENVPTIKPGQRRILFLGSSATLGWGVKEKETLTNRLEEMFIRDGKDTVVLNAGVGNYNTVRYVEQFFSKLRSIKPTDILIHYFVNDAEKLSSGRTNFILRHSQLAVTLWVVFHRLTNPSGMKSLERHYLSIYNPKSEGFQEMVSALKRLKDHAEQQNIRLYLAITPDIHSLNNYKFGFIHKRMKNIAEQNNFQFIDFFPTLKGLPPQKIWAMPGDPHPNGFGHKIMAETLYPVLSHNDSQKK